MSEFIVRVRRELQQRLRDIERELDGLQRLSEERNRLRRAIALLDDARPDARSKRQRSTTQAERRPRTPPGVNRQRALEAIRERPGVTLGELEGATGIGRPTLSNLTRRLEQEGTIVRDELPGGQLGLRSATPEVSEREQAPPETREATKRAEAPRAEGQHDAQPQAPDPGLTAGGGASAEREPEPARPSPRRRRAKPGANAVDSSAG